MIQEARARLLLAAVLGLILVGILLPAGASAAECTDTWTGPAEGSWLTATNWSAKHIPGSSDVACIGSGASVLLKKGGSVSVVGLQGEGTLEVTETALGVTGTGETWQLARLKLEYEGNLSGTGTLEITKALTWSGRSTMSGTGKTVLGPSSTNTIGSGNVSYGLSGRRLVNEGTITQLTYSTLAMVEGGVFENVGTYNINGESSVWQMISSGIGSLFLNKGTFQKAEGTGTAKISSDFESQGTVRTLSGLIKFSGTHSVVFGDGSQIEGSISAEKEPTVTLNSVSAPKGEIALREASAVVAAGKSPSIGTIKMDYKGNIIGTGTLEITKALSWINQSTMSGAGTTVIKPSAEATVNTYNGALAGRSLINQGTLTLEGEGTITGSEGALLENTGTLYLNSVESYGRSPGLYGGTSARLVNYGTVKKTVGEGKSRLNLNVENFGTIRATTGTVFFNAKGSTAVFESGSVAEGLFQLELAGMVGNHFRMPTGTITARESPITFEGGSSEIANLKIDYETKISGPGDVEVTQSLNWIGQSTIGGSGTMVLGPTSKNTLNSGATTATLSGRRLENEGTFTQTSYSRLNLNGSATFVNQGTYNLNAEPYPYWVPPLIKSEGAGPGRFVNSGTLQRTEGTGSALITSSVENSGPIVEKSGKIEIEHAITVPASTASPHHACAKDPVDCGTGNFIETQTDLGIGGRGVGVVLARTYSAQAAVAGSLGIFGYGWTNSFGDKLTSEEGGAKETLTEASGGTLTFTKSGASWLAPSWSADVLTGSGESGFTLTMRDQTKEKFNGSGRLESVTDHNGNETTLAYNGSGKLEMITDPGGRKITLTYNAEGLVEKAADPMGHEVKYAYESKQLKSVTLPGEASPNWQFKYDGSHRMTSMTDGRGGKTTNEYDSSNRVISQTDPMERKTTWEYAAFHTKITDKATGAVTDEWFNSNNQPISISRGYGTASATTESFTYTAAGLLASRTDGNGHTTTYEYDAAGNRIKETDPEGDETRWTYNAAHEVTSETKPNGEKTTITLDANGNPETVSRPAPQSKTQTISYEYGPDGEVESMTNPLGATWTYGYDKFGDRIAATDPEGDERTWAYNEDSQVTSKVSPRGNEEGAEAAKFTTSIERDAQGRPIKVTDPLGGTTKTAYDADGNVESVTDPNGRKTKFTYDADNELTKVERPNGAVEETGYDGAGQVVSQTDGNKQKTTYVRNVLEQPIETIDSLERKTTRTFDAAGNLKTLKDPDGRTTTYGYDKANRLKEVSYSAEPGLNTTLGYNENGDLTSMKDATGESTWEYDQLDRLTHSKNGDGETVSWAYNLGDEPMGLTYPNGKSISRSYDKAGRLESVTDWLGHTTSFAYNRDSEPTATTFPVATTDKDEYGYDRADRMASATMKKGAETLASLAYSRNPAGQLESLISKGLPGPETESFSYDENERLTKAGAAEFGYDAANNITKAPGTTNAFDKASEIESATGATFTFDKEGERAKETPSSGPATTYKYSQAGNLTAIERAEEGETPAIAESFSYGGSGLLASRTVGLATQHFVWDLSESPELLLSDGADSYVYGPGGFPVEAISSEEVPTYLHHDQLGSTRLLTNSSGEATGTFTYGAYGALTGHTGTATTALGYAGQYTLGQSGLQFLRARFYDPATAQFMTRDPVVEVTRQPYFYGGDNPLKFSDRTGQACEETVNVGPYTTTVPNLVDCAIEGTEEILESPATGPGVGVACAVAEPCPGILGIGGGIGLLLLGNLLHSEKDPCFNQGEGDLTGTLATIAAGLPGLLLDGAAARAGVDVPKAVRAVNALPGLFLEGVHALEGK